MTLKTKEICLTSLFTVLIIVGAFIKIPIPYIPFTLQFLFTTLAGILLGPKLGSLSVLAYIILGLIGVPVFTQGGGVVYVLKPTFGYIIGFLVGTFFTGFILNKNKEFTFKSILFASFVGLIIVYTFGLIYYYFISKFVLNIEMTIWTLFLYGFILSVPGDILLCILSAILGKRLKKFINF
ncbi:biotin transporter BioY [[Clostridium] colinum]|uniref:biotin transporter BioY n=1 Tax=[Clostridium] colinum TaxID=36835 RepID=UPI002023F4D7|nr:biotin transporter BioY [[Clostridium] colinum]